MEMRMMKKKTILVNTNHILHHHSWGVTIRLLLLRHVGPQPATRTMGVIAIRTTIVGVPRKRQHLQRHSSIQRKTGACIVVNILLNRIYKLDAMNVNRISVKLVIGVMNFKPITKSVSAIDVMHFIVEIAMRWINATIVEKSFVPRVVLC